MAPEDIDDLMHSMTIQGTSNKDGQSFAIEIGTDGVAELVKGPTGNLAGNTLRETGKWWAENDHFCMQITRFAEGRKLCPRIVREGERLTATRSDGTELGWSLSK